MGASQPLQMGKKGVASGCCRAAPLQMRKNGVEHHRPSAVERGLGAVEQGCHAMAVAYIHT
jgi:hypothetical protein